MAGQDIDDDVLQDHESEKEDYKVSPAPLDLVFGFIEHDLSFVLALLAVYRLYLFVWLVFSD